MKFRVLKAKALSLALVCAAGASVRAAHEENGAKNGATVEASPQSSQQSSQQMVSAARDATVTLCVESGDVTVRGWDREEVRATVAAGARVEMRRAEGEASRSPASRVEVLAFGANDGAGGEGSCSRGGGAVTLEVPRGGFVQLKSYSGRISVADVAGARVETLNGDTELRGLSQWVEATSANGTISLRSSKGRAHLRTISGRIEASDVAASAAGDDFSARTTTGEISLARIGHTQVEASTTNGAIDLAGSLARGGLYTLHSQSGDVSVALPEDSSFALVARVYTGEIVTEFPIRQAARKATGEGGGLIGAGRLTGITGKSDTPDATLSLATFNGSINLRKAASRR
jgi:DUF4097 and DUF4098 domain-containing protein YvlB